MAKQRMKLDYNNLIRNINEVTSNSANGFGIAIGIDVLSTYLKLIAERAIELKDDVLLELLLDMNIVKKEGSGGNE